MTDALETLRGYVHFLREREGVRQVRLTRAAREGLAKIVSSKVGTRVPSRPIHPRASVVAGAGPAPVPSRRGGTESQNPPVPKYGPPPRARL